MEVIDTRLNTKRLAFIKLTAADQQNVHLIKELTIVTDVETCQPMVGIIFTKIQPKKGE